MKTCLPPGVITCMYRVVMAELFLEVNWPAPKHIRAITTTRNGGQSTGPYFSLNLGDHVGDKPEAVAANRQRLFEKALLPDEPLWLKQTHSTDVIDAKHWQADIEAGWRGLRNGIIENTLAQFKAPSSDIIVWLGPAIGPQAFEVGPEVKAGFVAMDAAAELAFISTHSDRYLADIYLLARQRLIAQGVTAIYGGDNCTFTEKQRFFSFRRDGVTGRMATLIWIAAE